MSARTRAKDRIRDLAWSAYVWPKASFGNRLQGAVIGGLESRRVRREWDRAERVLLVHTQGKVGSKAIFASLKGAMAPTDAIFHTHRINPDDMLEVEAERAGLAPRRTWYTAAFLGRHLRRPHDKDVVVIAAVRDPIERALSAFLQNLERYGESGRPFTEASQVSAHEVARLFVRHFDEHTVSRWIEVELNEMFDVDLFEAPFDHETGFQIVGNGRCRVGVIRHDRFSEALVPFLGAMTGLHPGTAGRVNESSSKAYGDVYKTLRTTMRLPEPLVRAVYDSAYARHFFTPAERERAVCRWADSGQAATADMTTSG